MSDSTHFVANIRVEKVVLETPSTPRDLRMASSGQATLDQKRTVGEVTNLVVKAPSMDVLKQRVMAHIALIEDDVPVDPRAGKVTR